MTAIAWHVAMLHTYKMRTAFGCPNTSRRRPADILHEIITRGRRYAAHMLEGAA